MRRAPRPEAEAGLGERRVPVRLQRLHHRLLDEAVEHRRDAERPHATRRLRDLHPPHRLRLVGAVDQLSPDRGPMPLQVGRQIVDTHAVDPRRTLVAPHSCQRRLQVLSVKDDLHRRSRDRRAFEAGSRRASFGRLGRKARGFTLRRGAQGQLALIFLPHGSLEIAALLASSTVRAFGGNRRLLCPQLTSAPRSGGLAATSVPRDTAQTSRGKTDRLHRTPAGFTTPAIDGPGLRDQRLARPAG